MRPSFSTFIIIEHTAYTLQTEAMAGDDAVAGDRENRGRREEGKHRDNGRKWMFEDNHQGAIARKKNEIIKKTTKNLACS